VDEGGDYPLIATLWRGVVLNTLAEAFLRVFEPMESLWWDRPDCILTDGQGTYCALTFTEGDVIGVLCDGHSERDVSPESGEFDWTPYLRGIPPRLLAVAREHALRIMLESYPGTVTAAFWSEGARLTAAEPWSAVVEHGGHALDRFLQDANEAIADWNEALLFSPAQTALIRSLLDRRTTYPETPVTLTTAEVATLRGEASGSLAPSRQLLAAIGITLP